MGKVKWHPDHPYYKRVANVIDQNQHYMDGKNSESRKKLIEENDEDDDEIIRIHTTHNDGP